MSDKDSFTIPKDISLISHLFNGESTSTFITTSQKQKRA